MRSLLLCLFLLSALLGRGEDTVVMRPLSQSRFSFGAGQMQLRDEVLSSQDYQGITGQFYGEKMRFLSAEKKTLSRQYKLAISYAHLRNAARTAAINYVEFSLGLGYHYHLRPLPNFKILLGASLDWDFANKLHSSNVNNPYSMDFSLSVGPSLIFSYRLPMGTSALEFRYSVQSPLLGVFFVPDYGESYYELLKWKNVADGIHFGAYHNYLKIQNRFDLCLDLQPTRLQLSVQFDNSRHHANVLHFQKNAYWLSLGWVYQFQSFKGREKVPSMFISIDQ